MNIKQIKILLFLLLISCSSNRFDEMKSEAMSYTRKMAAEQHYISRSMFEIGNVEGNWGRKAISELDKSKRMIDQLYSAIGDKKVFYELKRDLLDNFEVIDVDANIKDLLYPDETKLSLAELAIYLRYRGHAQFSMTQFDQIRMFNFKTDSGYVIGVAGGRSSKRPVITNGEKTLEFDDSFFITLNPDEISDLGGKVWLTFPTHLGDTSVLMKFDK